MKFKNKSYQSNVWGHSEHKQLKFNALSVIELLPSLFVHIVCGYFLWRNMLAPAHRHALWWTYRIFNDERATVATELKCNEVDMCILPSSKMWKRAFEVMGS